MAKYFICAVKDDLTNVYMQPVFSESIPEIERIFKHQINTIPLWKENAKDFSLWTLGRFDDNTGEIISDVKKLNNGTAFVEREKNDPRKEYWDNYEEGEKDEYENL